MGGDKILRAANLGTVQGGGAYEPTSFGPHEARLFLQRFGLDAKNADPVTAPLCAALLNAAQHVDELNMECADLKDKLDKTTGKLKRAEELMDSDTLTGLGNRRGFSAVLNRMIKRRERNKDAFPKAQILFIDMNDFRTINERFSHQGGDDALVHVGKIIRSNVREGDYVARVGGDEFAVILYDVSRSEAEGVAKKIMAGVLENPLTLRLAPQKDPKTGEPLPDKGTPSFEDAKLSVTCGLHKLKKSDTPEAVMYSMSVDMKGKKGKAKSFAAAYIAARDAGGKRPSFKFE